MTSNLLSAPAVYLRDGQKSNQTQIKVNILICVWLLFCYQLLLACSVLLLSVKKKVESKIVISCFFVCLLDCLLVPVCTCVCVFVCVHYVCVTCVSCMFACLLVCLLQLVACLLVCLFCLLQLNELNEINFDGHTDLNRGIFPSNHIACLLRRLLACGETV